MYKPLIEIALDKLKTELDDDVIKAVQSFNIKVNKEELEKALRYDREQYLKGWKDGHDSSVTHAYWEDFGYGIRCSKCHFHPIEDEETNYCPNCGSIMDAIDKNVGSKKED